MYGSGEGGVGSTTDCEEGDPTYPGSIDTPSEGVKFRNEFVVGESLLKGTGRIEYIVQ